MATISHQISLELETAARIALGLDSRRGMGGIIDADYIDIVGNALVVLVAATSPYYKNGDIATKAKISEFLYKYEYLKDANGDKETYAKGVSESAKEMRKLIDELESQ